MRVRLAILVASIIAQALIPWTVPYWPTQDMPRQWAIAHVARSLRAGEPDFVAYLHDAFRLVPTCGFHELLVSLEAVFGVRNGDRLLTSAVLVGIPASVYVLLRRTWPARWENTHLVVPLATGSLLFLGLYGYLIGAILAVLSLAFAWGRPRGDLAAPLDVRSGVIAAVLMLLTAFFDPLCAGLVVFTLAVLCARTLRTPRGWIALAPAAPVLLFIAGSWLTTHAPNPADGFPMPLAWRGWSEGLRATLDITMLLRTFDRTEAILRALPFVLLVCFAARRAISMNPGEATAEHDVRRMLGALLVLWIAAPALLGGTTPPGAFTRPLPIWFAALSPRFVFYGLLLVPLLVELPAVLRKGVGVATLVLVLVLALVQRNGIVKASAAVERFVALTSDLPRGATLLPLAMTDLNDVPGRLDIMTGAWGYVVASRNVVTPYLFAAQGNESSRFLPVAYNHRFGPGFLPLVREPESLGGPCAPEEEECFAVRPDDIDDWVRQIASYDATVLVNPPPDLVEACVAKLHILRHIDDMWLVQGNPPR